MGKLENVYELVMEGVVHVDHALRLYDGQFEPVHHHDWLVEVCVAAPELDPIGAVMDFFVLDGLLKDTLAEIDHKLLNEHPAFHQRNSSSEHVARYLFDRLEPRLPEGVSLRRVTIHRDEAIRARFSYAR